MTRLSFHLSDESMSDDVLLEAMEEYISKGGVVTMDFDLSKPIGRATGARMDERGLLVDMELTGTLLKAEDLVGDRGPCFSIAGTVDTTGAWEKVMEISAHVGPPDVAG